MLVTHVAGGKLLPMMAWGSVAVQAREQEVKWKWEDLSTYASYLFVLGLSTSPGPQIYINWRPGVGLRKPIGEQVANEEVNKKTLFIYLSWSIWSSSGL